MSDITSQVPPVPPTIEGPSFALPKIADRGPRVWPGVVILVLEGLLMTVPLLVARGTMGGMMLAKIGAPLFGLLGVVLWWLLASRIRWLDRFVTLGACVALGAAAYPFYHQSFDIMVVIMFVLPVLTAAWVLWLVVTPYLSWRVRRAGLLVVFLLVWAHFALMRFDGVSGVSFESTLAYRWTPTALDHFGDAVRAGTIAQGNIAEPVVLGPGDWPGFRGPRRDGRQTGVRIATDWQQNPPRLVWKHRVGLGWSSFAVVGNRLFTQMQWDEPNEAVVCYAADSGNQIWVHKDQAHFKEKLGGNGPRATPTFHDGKVYALGATGRLNCLDAATGKPLWSRDIIADSGAAVPMWGFASSPLVSQGIVTVFTGASGGKTVLGYRADSGEIAWYGGDGLLSYSSLQPARLGGTDQILMATDAGLTAFEPTRGAILWHHEWSAEGMARIVQPAVLSDTDVLVGTGMGVGTKRLRISHEGQGEGQKWTASEVWKTRTFKPYFNDLVIHKGHLYGFDGEYVYCVNLDDKTVKWRQEGYGAGQILLLADQDLLLVLSEEGKVALVEARPDGHKELCRFDAIDGKTWNHPVVVGGRLFVRNSEWAACYDLSGSK
jgi:outer membrane protein assembly factor BamB